MPETRPPIDFARSSLAQLAEAMADRRLPPVERWNPTHCGHSGMRIDRAGRWWHEERPIERDSLVRLFATVLRREPDGSHVLVTPVEKLTIDVELAALVAIAMRIEGDGADRHILFQLNRGDIVTLGPASPLRLREGVPIVALEGGLEAMLARPVWLELAEVALREEPTGVWSDGAFFALDSQ